MSIKFKIDVEGTAFEYHYISDSLFSVESTVETLHDACEKGNIRQVQEILETESINICLETNQAGLNAVHIACKNGRETILQCMVNMGLTDLNEKDIFDCYTPLHHAVLNSNLEAVKYLSDIGLVDLDGEDQMGQSPIHLACNLGFIKITRYLVEKAGVDTKKTCRCQCCKK